MEYWREKKNNVVILFTTKSDLVERSPHRHHGSVVGATKGSNSSLQTHTLQARPLTLASGHASSARSWFASNTERAGAAGPQPCPIACVS